MRTSRLLPALALVAVLSLLAGCGGDDTDDASTDDTSTDDTTEGAGDASTTAASTGDEPSHDEPEEGAEPTDGAVFPGAEWATATPEKAGLDPAAIDELRAYLDGTDSNCMAVVKDGKLVAAEHWNDTSPETDQEIYSASKSVTSTLVGIAQDLGYLDIDEPASTYLTEWQGTDSEDVTIRNLLSNDSGRYYDFQTDYLKMPSSEDPSAFAIALDQQHPVGEHWEYNNSAIQTLQAVLERATEQDMNEFATEHLFEPLGMSSHYSEKPSGTELAFMGVQSGCLDMARFGYLFLQGGNWDGEQVIPADWVAEATAPSQSLNQAYGYLWWLNEPNWLAPVVNTKGEGLFWPDTPDDAYAALGFGNQIVLVIPSLDMVVTRAGPANPAALLGRGQEEGAEPVPNTSVNEIGRLAAEAAAGS